MDIRPHQELQYLEDEHLPSEEGHGVEVAVADVGFSVPW